MDLGDRMKRYERIGVAPEFLPTLPVIVRLDGRAFHTFTRGFDRPYHKPFNLLMWEVTGKLMLETRAVMGYTQSDEISLVLHTDNPLSQIYFNGRRDKINSILAAKCSVEFCMKTQHYLNTNRTAEFDCRSFQLPSKNEVCNYLVWREQDATRNSIQLLGQANFSHKQLQGLSCNQIQEKLWQEKQINWNDQPAFFKRGVYFQKRQNRDRSIDTVPIMIYNSTEYTVEKLTSLVNREGFVFYGEEPRYESVAS